jgi:hypothetical protein
MVVKALKTSLIIREPEIRRNDEVTPESRSSFLGHPERLFCRIGPRDPPSLTHRSLWSASSAFVRRRGLDHPGCPERVDANTELAPGQGQGQVAISDGHRGSRGPRIGVRAYFDTSALVKRYAHPIGALDAIHVASAQLFAARLSMPGLTFVSANKREKEAAVDLGLIVRRIE